jgi:hypothetical protein
MNKEVFCVAEIKPSDYMKHEEFLEWPRKY